MCFARRNFDKVETRACDDVLVAQGAAGGKLDEVALAEAVITDDCRHFAALLTRANERTLQAYALRLKADCEGFYILNRNNPEAQSLERLPCSELICFQHGNTRLNLACR